MSNETIFILDQARIVEMAGERKDNLLKAIEAINEGRARVIDGVVRQAPGGSIIAHLPLKEIPYPGFEEALKIAQSTTIIAQSISTGIVLAAIVVQTKYLAEKLNKIQKISETISKDLHSQNIIFYMDKVSEYFGYLFTARMLLQDRSLADEIADIGSNLIVGMAVYRNKIFSFIDDLLVLAKDLDLTTPRHAELMVKFVNDLLGILPFGIHMEHLLSARLGKLRLSENILRDGAESYRTAISYYKVFLNNWHIDLLKGQLGDRQSAYIAIEPQAKELFDANYEENLLALPMGQKMALTAPFSRLDEEN